jgi:hypothetical protein
MNDQNQNDSSNVTQQQQDDQQQVTIRAGGPEGGAVVLEQAGTSSQEVGQETSKPLERTQEQIAEKAQESQKPTPTQTKQPKPHPKKPKKKVDRPKTLAEQASERVFGYLVPSTIAKNVQQVAKRASRANAKTGVGCLYMFLDRLFRMRS